MGHIGITPEKDGSSNLSKLVYRLIGLCFLCIVPTSHFVVCTIEIQLLFNFQKLLVDFLNQSLSWYKIFSKIFAEKNLQRLNCGMYLHLVKFFHNFARDRAGWQAKHHVPSLSWPFTTIYNISLIS